MEIPLNAKVECTDGLYGNSAYVLINPLNDQVTQMVVKEDLNPHTEYIVPIDLVTETIYGTIRLSCSKAELEKLDPFVMTEYIEVKIPERNLGYGGAMNGMASYYYLPYVSQKNTVQVAVDHLQIPPGELAFRRGTRIEATDGYVGHVDEFVVNPQNSHITHLVMREGHLWGQKDVIIPLSAVGTSSKDTVLLKLNKHQIESLPTFPLQRRWS
jgi:hypothetical protein